MYFDIIAILIPENCIYALPGINIQMNGMKRDNGTFLNEKKKFTQVWISKLTINMSANISMAEQNDSEKNLQKNSPMVQHDGFRLPIKE